MYFQKRLLGVVRVKRILLPLSNLFDVVPGKCSVSRVHQVGLLHMMGPRYACEAPR